MRLTRDMQLDIHNPPLPLIIDVTIFSGDVSYNKIAEIAKALESVFAEQNIPIAKYSVHILPLSDKPQDQDQAASWVNARSVSYYPADRMDQENLPQAMEQFEADRVVAYNQKYKK